MVNSKSVQKRLLVQQPSRGDITKQEFWERFGVNSNPSSNAYETWVWPDGRIKGYLPPITLDNLFKYVVPKINKLGYNVRSYTYSDGLTDAFVDGLGKYGMVDIVERDKDPAQALYQAVCKVIEEERREAEDDKKEGGNS